MAQDFKHTIQLPKTDFPMKADLARREPEFLKKWEEANLYEQILKKGENKPKFILHDGPPYANGMIHLGHVMNKTLKDIVVKSKTMSGFYSPYVPGWDCHGLPIEHQVAKNLGSKAKTISKLELRKECRKYAEKYIEIQRQDFKRLGIFGNWNNPYRTMDYSYQAQIAREFGKIVEKGFVYRSRRSIHWCISCETALAEAEIEYADHKSPSIFVTYPVIAGWEEAGFPATKPEDRFVMIWTTTPWTLPASMAIAFNENEEYVLVGKSNESKRMVVAKPLVESIRKLLGLKDSEFTIFASVGKGKNLKNLKAQHPFLSRNISFFPGEHVTMEAGTGLVHTAPGHGEEDYELGLKYGVEIYSPVNADGRFDSTVEHFAGLKVFEANPKIIEHLKSVGRLFEKAIEIEHSYPHCWRCKNPVIFRATAQWFLSLEHLNLRQETLCEIDRVNWVPKWGRDRIYGMISDRPDWCLSRQRAWGVPIIAFECKKCSEFLLSPDAISQVAEQFETEGADIWFAKEANDLLPKGTVCKKCGGKEFDKGQDILDVWFDSGSSHAAVLEKRKELAWPGDVYLEGSDQHRGWFHSSLLEAMATRGRAPFKSVITHGFVVDGEGKKMSKSVGNYVSAQDIMKERGAELVRLWIATEDYRNDVRISKEILDRVTESYRRIRNTARFCLGNLFDFDPNHQRVVTQELAREIDRWAVDRISRLIEKCRRAYEDYEYHLVVTALNEFCVVDLSSLYLDISKDVLYCDAKDGSRRKSAQTVLFEVASAIATLLAPILPVTAEEIWQFLPSFSGKMNSVHLAEFSEPLRRESDDFLRRWSELLAVRGEVSKVLERLRKDKKIGQSLEAFVEVKAPAEYEILLKQYLAELPNLWIVSRTKLVSTVRAQLERLESEVIPGLVVGAGPIEGERCDRCWTYAEDLGVNPKFPSLCGRCSQVVGIT